MTNSPQSNISDVSDTALWVAYYRGKETFRKNPAFQDPLALMLAGERGKAIAESMPYSRLMDWVMVVRTTAIDQLITDSLAMGVDTVLNLGAGLDTRPYRMALPKDLKWIEIDFPHLIDLKNEKLKNEAPVCQLERICVDLSKRPERQVVFAKIGAQSRKVLVITEGVIPYLSNEQASELSEDLLSTTGFAYWIQDYRNGGLAKSTPKLWKKRLQGAPFLFNALEWIQFFSERGWKEEKVITAGDETRRLKRSFPFIFPWSLVIFAYFLVSKNKREKIKKQTGYVLLKRDPQFKKR